MSLCKSCAGAGTRPRARFPGDTPEKCKPCSGTGKAKPRQRKEAELEKQADDFLGWDGWRAIVTDPKRLRGLGVSEKGIPDRLYIRYTYIGAEAVNADAECLWIEWKTESGRLSDRQARWIIAERARGALVWIAGGDFPATYEGFLAFYRASGLLRRAGL